MNRCVYICEVMDAITPANDDGVTTRGGILILRKGFYSQLAANAWGKDMVRLARSQMTDDATDPCFRTYWVLMEN